MENLAKQLAASLGEPMGSHLIERIKLLGLDAERVMAEFLGPDPSAAVAHLLGVSSEDMDSGGQQAAEGYASGVCRLARIAWTRERSAWAPGLGDAYAASHPYRPGGLGGEVRTPTAEPDVIGPAPKLRRGMRASARASDLAERDGRESAKREERLLQAFAVAEAPS